jgi:hypothetical protein
MRLATHNTDGVISLRQEMEGARSENLALVVSIVGVLLAGSYSCPRSLAFGMAFIFAVSPDWPVVRCGICVVAVDFVFARAHSRIPR